MQCLWYQICITSPFLKPNNNNWKALKWLPGRTMKKIPINFVFSKTSATFWSPHSSQNSELVMLSKLYSWLAYVFLNINLCFGKHIFKKWFHKVVWNFPLRCFDTEDSYIFEMDVFFCTWYFQSLLFGCNRRDSAVTRG